MKFSEVKKRATYYKGIVALVEKRDRGSRTIKYTGKSSRILGVDDPQGIISGKLVEFANDLMAEIRHQALFQVPLSERTKTDAKAWSQLSNLPTFTSGEVSIQYDFIRIGDKEFSLADIRRKFKTNDVYSVPAIYSYAWEHAWKNVMHPAIDEWLAAEGIEI